MWQTNKCTLIKSTVSYIIYYLHISVAIANTDKVQQTAILYE